MDTIFREKIFLSALIKGRGRNGELWMLPMKSTLRKGKRKDVRGGEVSPLFQEPIPTVSNCLQRPSLNWHELHLGEELLSSSQSCETD